MIWRNAGLLLAAFVIQQTMAQKLAVGGILPDFILIALIYTSLAYGSLPGIIFGFSIGLLQDFYGPATHIGLNALCKSVVGFLVGLGKEGLYRENLVILTAVLCVGLLVHETLYSLVDARFGMDLFLQKMLRVSIPTVVYTQVSGIVIALLLAYREGQFHARRLFPK